MPSTSKAKGNRFERQVASLLSDWLGDDFRRIPNSGALRWNGTAFVYGDILPPEGFPFVIECKHAKKSQDLEIDAFIRDCNSKIAGWFFDELMADVHRCEEESGEKVSGLLFFRRNYRPIRVVMRRDLWRFIPVKVRERIPHLVVCLPKRDDLVVVGWDEIEKEITPPQLLQAQKADFRRL